MPKNDLKPRFLTQKCPQTNVFQPNIRHFNKNTLYAKNDSKYLLELGYTLLEKLSEQEINDCKILTTQTLKQSQHKCQINANSTSFMFRGRYLESKEYNNKGPKYPTSKLICRIKSKSNKPDPIFTVYPKFGEKSGFLVSCEVDQKFIKKVQYGYRDNIFDAAQDAAELVLMKVDDIEFKSKLNAMAKRKHINEPKLVEVFDEVDQFCHSVKCTGWFFRMLDLRG